MIQVEVSGNIGENNVGYALNAEEIRLYKSGSWIVAVANLRHRLNLDLYEAYAVFLHCGYPIISVGKKQNPDVHIKDVSFSFNYVNN